MRKSLADINRAHFARMVKWGANNKRLAESFGISEASVGKLRKELKMPSDYALLVQSNSVKTRQAKELLEQGGMSVTEAARTVGADVQSLRYRGVRSSTERYETRELLEAKATLRAEPPTYANGRLTSVGN